MSSCPHSRHQPRPQNIVRSPLPFSLRVPHLYIFDISSCSSAAHPQEVQCPPNGSPSVNFNTMKKAPLLTGAHLTRPFRSTHACPHSKRETGLWFMLRVGLFSGSRLKSVTSRCQGLPWQSAATTVTMSGNLTMTISLQVGKMCDRSSTSTSPLADSTTGCRCG